ncbi:MAG: hypothetical protein JXA15_04515 [Spirochaetales bacterium]|nr:hypothetical protein [Spirochaetales bacterium]
MPERKVSFFWISLFLLGLAYLASFAASLAEFATGAAVIRRFALSWELARAATRFFAWIPAMVFAACAVGANLVPREPGGKGRAGTMAGSASALALAAGAALLFMAPLAESRRLSYEARSDLFMDSRDAAQKALETKDPAKALALVSLAESVDPDEPGLRTLKDRALAEANRLIALPPKESAPPRTSERLDLSAADFLRIALEAEAAADWYTAHYEAGKALLLDPKMAEARLLQSRAWERIRSQAEDPELAAKSDFFARKLAAYGSLREGDALRAWRDFTRLAAEFPRDPDVARYLRESELALRTLSYFAAEARSALADRAIGPFAARLGNDDGLIFFSASSCAPAGSSLWLDKPELMAISGNEVLWHVGAPHGLLEADVLLLRGIDGEEAEAPVLDPSTYQGSPPWEAAGALSPPMEPRDALHLATLGNDLSTLGPGALIEAAKTSDRFGLDPERYATELARRAGAVAGMLALALIAAGLGSRLRSPRRPGALATLSSLALIAFAAGPIIEALDSAGALVLVALRSAIPEPGAWIAWGGFLATTILAGIAVAARYLSRD